MCESSKAFKYHVAWVIPVGKESLDTFYLFEDFF